MDSILAGQTPDNGTWALLMGRLGKSGYIARRPQVGQPHTWTDAQHALVKHFFKTLKELEENPMQRTFTLEIKVDLRDKEKLPLIKQLLAEKAREVYAVVALLRDDIKPQVAIYSDDFFESYEEINIMQGGSLSEGTNFPQAAEASQEARTLAAPPREKLAVAKAPGGTEDAPEISSELLAALRGA